MTDDELKVLDELFAKTTQEKWNFHCMRESDQPQIYQLKDPTDPQSVVPVKSRIDPRFDIYIGEPLSDEEKLQLRKQPTPLTKLKRRKQIAHFHFVSPEIYYNNPNYENDGNFCALMHEMFPKMSAEIKRLRNELRRNHGQ